MSAPISSDFATVGNAVAVCAQPPGEIVPTVTSSGKRDGHEAGDGRPNAAPVKASKKALVNTDSLDGLRAVAVMHIVLGHFSTYTDWTGETGPVLVDGFDLMGGTSIGLFFLISGFVLMIGYGSAGEAPAHLSRWDARCDRCFSCFCIRIEEEPPSTKPESSPPEASPGPAVSKAFDIRSFYWKRFARLIPLWYMGNILALPLYFGGYSSIRPAEEFWIGLALTLPPLGLNSWFQFLPPAAHLWTISTMLTFYLLFPALYPRVRRVRSESLRSFALVLYCIQILLFLVGFLSVFLLWAIDLEAFTVSFDDLAGPFVRGYWFARSWPLNRLPIFVMGLCAARQSEVEALDPSISQTCCGSCGIGKGPKAWILVSLLCLVYGVGVAEQLTGGQGIATRFFGEMLLPAVFYELLLAFARPAAASEPPSCLHAFLGSRPLRFLADSSLGVYVVHDTMARSLALVLHGPTELSPKIPDDWRMPIWGPVAMLPLSLLAGWAVTRFFEKPMQKIILERALPKK